MQQSLLRWYRQNRRDLPWRVAPGSAEGSCPDPYLVLVSEAMLQQTQVATVIPYFDRFMGRFPTLAALATASEQEVLRLWQGLGYYSRARHLHATAKIVLNRYDGRMPATVDELMALPGVGRYTAGAIASLAFDQRAPILDGNVVRVLCRLDLVQHDPRTPEVRQMLWSRAEEILPDRNVGDFNSALMELGATVCMARSPKCLLCPVREHCQAQAAGLQDQVPRPAASKPRPMEKRWVFCIRSGNRWLLEQRPAEGRWAGMWQFPTSPVKEASLLRQSAATYATLQPRTRLLRLGTISHDLTHRRYEFEVFLAKAAGASAKRHADRPRRWVQLDGLSDLPISKPQQRIAEMLRTRIRLEPA